MTYKLVRAPNLKTLEFYTQEECLKGWQPQGNPFSNAEMYVREWVQAMTRTTLPPERDNLRLKEPRTPPLDCQGVPLAGGVGKAKTREK